MCKLNSLINKPLRCKNETVQDSNDLILKIQNTVMPIQIMIKRDLHPFSNCLSKMRLETGFQRNSAVPLEKTDSFTEQLDLEPTEILNPVSI